MRDFLSNSNSASPIRISDIDDGSAENSVVWTSAKIQKILDDHEAGLIDIKTLKNSPFKDNDPAFKRANIVFEYTPEEMSELKKCKADVVYFAENYCQIMTEKGVTNIDLHDYQKEIVNSFKLHRMNILMASRQVGKCVIPSTKITILGKTNQFTEDFKNFSKYCIDKVNGAIETTASELFFFIKKKAMGKLSIVDRLKRQLYIALIKIEA